MISIEEAFSIVDKTLAGRRLASELLPTHTARGRVLASDALSRLDLPPFNKSAMDGYAVMADDERDTYTVLEIIPAGSVPAKPLVPGTAAKVMTGAPVPEGSGRVIIVDDLLATGGTIRAAVNLVDRLDAELVGISVLVELSNLKGREKLAGQNVQSLIVY